MFSTACRSTIPTTIEKVSPPPTAGVLVRRVGSRALCEGLWGSTYVCGSSKLNAYSCLPEWMVWRPSSELSSSKRKINQHAIPPADVIPCMGFSSRKNQFCSHITTLKECDVPETRVSSQLVINCWNAGTTLTGRQDCQLRLTEKHRLICFNL